MPGAFAHILMADLAIARDAVLAPWLTSYQGLVHLGAQGPDPLLFYGLIPFKPRPGVLESRELSLTLHHQAPELTLVPMVQALHELYPTNKAAHAYVYGYFMHYWLDRRVHPWVYWKTGFDKDGKLSFPWTGRHGGFETKLDLAIRDEHGIPVQAALPHKLLRGTSDPLVGTLWDHAYGAIASQPGKWAHEGGLDMICAKGLFHDPLGLKSGILSLLARPDHVVRSMVRPDRLEEQQKALILNSSKEAWRNPASGVWTNQSVADLLELALIDSTMTLEAMALPDTCATLLAGMENYDGHQPRLVKKYMAGGFYKNDFVKASSETSCKRRTDRISA